MPGIKKVDLLLIRSFVPPFLLSTCIALFVLVMQTFYLYIDDIMGKGIGLFILAELLFYLSIRLIPLALIVGVLLGSVMVYGGMGEKFELSSFKSAGVSLLRMMRPLIVLTALVSIFSFIVSDHLGPTANLKFLSRMYDIKQQKPGLNLEEGVFNDDFVGYTIYIGEKDEDQISVKDVRIYDQTEFGGEKLKLVTAKSGEIFVTEDRRYMVFRLYDGNQYLELDKEYREGKRVVPFVRTRFEEWQKVFDLSEFELDRTDEELFSSHHYMQTTSQLQEKIDTFTVQIARTKERYEYDFRGMLDPEFREEETPVTAADEYDEQYAADRRRRHLKQNLGGLDTMASLVLTADRTYKRGLTERALSDARAHAHTITSTNTLSKSLTKSKVNHIFEKYSKYSLALVCLFFLFIGAPMGAIVRRGGFGYPMLVSIVFFMLFFIMYTTCKKLTQSLALNAYIAAWLPSFIILAAGILLTRKAMNDSKMNLSRLSFLKKIFRKTSHAPAT